MNMSLINPELLREDVKEFYELITKRANISVLKQLLRRPSIALIKAMTKMLNEHISLLESGEYNVFEPDYFPNPKTQKKYLRVVRKLFNDIYVPFNKNSKYIPKTTIVSKKLDDVPVDYVIPFNADRSKVIMHIHGGGYVVGSPEIYHAFAARLAVMTNIPVIIPDYRLAPEHKFPAGLFDCVDVYQQILNQGIKPENIIITGDSAGGGMTLAFLMYLRDQDMALPAGAIPISPYADLTYSGMTMVSNAPKDIVVADFPLYYFGLSYIDLRQVKFDFPLVSPVFGNYQGLPKMLVVVSEDEMLYDDSLRVVERAQESGVEVSMFSRPDMPHVFPCTNATYDWEEVTDAFNMMQKFILKTLYSRYDKTEKVTTQLT